ncbi:uncharacterized protein BX664DRAFT_356557 [Halteromyces radiatus]|uniref:uncharacterized protein n=1 Tax=Halteromyces radiatus TaxID=101107 RepID=UPI00221EC3CE|nr:uncharacterized protein BX664DRAFT_356557 [Halteromyces radiatus]KAI8097300.1 hypothetical protein BX664DRAFT_356557 [Halteromyces radiatus]
MDYTLQQHSDSTGWVYSHETSLRTETHEPLREPVPFEDFQFSFGLDPGFAMPVPLDMPPPVPALNDSNSLLPMDIQSDGLDTTTSNNPLLDENDQKAFSQFLDAFFVDKDGQMSNAEQMASQFSTMYDIQPPPLSLNDNFEPIPPSIPDPYHVATSMFLPKPTTNIRPNNNDINDGDDDDDDDDEYRRSSILQSLDQQKQFHQRLNRVASVQQQKQQSRKENINDQGSIGPNAIFLQQSNQVSAPFITKHPSSAQRYHVSQHAPYPPPERQHSSSASGNQDQKSSRSMSTPTRRNKSNKELLTEEEKRNNHIASEQKRRSTIRNGFKDLTDIVPTLKNINNSKSTVLFKAVDYIKYLEKRNKSLREKVGSLEVRVKVEGRVSDILMHSSALQHTPTQSSPPSMAPSQSSPISQQSYSESGSLSSTAVISNEESDGIIKDHRQQQQQQQQQQQHYCHDNNSSGGVAAALLAHKSQQKQLMALQEQLQYHQRLLAQQDEHYHRNTNKDSYNNNYHSISSSSNSSSSHSSPQSADLYQHPPVSSSRWNNNLSKDTTTTATTTSTMHTHVKMEVDNEEPLKNVMGLDGEWWPTGCKGNSAQRMKAHKFCQSPDHHDNAATMCLCHHHPLGWPVCKQQQQQKRSDSSFTLCQEDSYAACLMACDAAVETILCQQTQLLQCTLRTPSSLNVS